MTNSQTQVYLQLVKIEISVYAELKSDLNNFN